MPDGNYRCGSCTQCTYTKRCKTFTHPHTGQNIPIKGSITCSSTHVIYIIRCQCGLTYVGKTSRELRTRISEHRSRIRNGDERSPVAAHFKAAGHNLNTFRYLGVEKVERSRRGGDIEKKLLQRETYWIYKLNTMSPNGLNEEFDIRPFLWINIQSVFSPLGGVTFDSTFLKYCIYLSGGVLVGVRCHVMSVLLWFVCRYKAVCRVPQTVAAGLRLHDIALPMSTPLLLCNKPTLTSKWCSDTVFHGCMVQYTTKALNVGEWRAGSICCMLSVISTRLYISIFRLLFPMFVIV